MRVITLRVSDEMHEALRTAVETQQTTLNRLLSTLAAEYLRKGDEEQLYRGCGALADDPDEASVEYAFAAQSEVVTRGE